MGLLTLLQQGQTQLSAGSFPNDTPINDPQSGFIQENSPNYTYENETFGQVNNGSVLINTLDDTSLDNTNINSNTGIPTPNNVSYPNNYPEPVSGKFGGSPSQYESPYSANNPYLDTIDTISIPANNNQVYSLDNTGLDNLNSNFDPTTFRPDEISAPTNYGNVPSSPSVQLGEFGGAPSQYNEPYTPNSTYLDQIDSPEFTSIQSSSISNSGLSTDTSNAASTTFVVPLIDNITTYPADNVTHNTLTSGVNAAPQPFVQVWNSNNSYWNYFETNPGVFNPGEGERQQYNPSLLERITRPITNTLDRIF
jgi:hypothetical protein